MGYMMTKEIEMTNVERLYNQGYGVVEIAARLDMDPADVNLCLEDAAFRGYRDMCEEPWDGFNSDAEADADVLRSAGMGTDEDYGYYGDGDF